MKVFFIYLCICMYTYLTKGYYLECIQNVQVKENHELKFCKKIGERQITDIS